MTKTSKILVIIAAWVIALLVFGMIDYYVISHYSHRWWLTLTNCVAGGLLYYWSVMFYKKEKK